MKLLDFYIMLFFYFNHNDWSLLSFYQTSNCIKLFRSVGVTSYGRRTSAYADKQMIVNPLYGTDEANEAVSTCKLVNI